MSEQNESLPEPGKAVQTAGSFRGIICPYAAMSGVPQPEHEINIRAFVLVVLKGRRIAYFIVGLALLIGILSYLLDEKIYQTELTFLPITPGEPQQQSSLANFLGNLPMGGPQQPGPEQHVVTILLSRSLSEKVVDALDLMPIIYRDLWDETLDQWKKKDWRGRDISPPQIESAGGYMLDKVLVVEIKPGGVISILIKWPERIFIPLDKRESEATKGRFPAFQHARIIAEEYVRQLQDYLFKNEVTAVKRQRRFIEKQIIELEEEKKQLEEALIIFSEGSSTIEIDEDSLTIISGSSNILAEISSLTIELGVVKKIYGGDNNEKVIEISTKLAKMRNKLANLALNKKSLSSTERKIIVPLSKVPILSLEYQRLIEDKALKQSIYANFKSQLETLKIKEAKEETTFHTLDKPLDAYPIFPRLSKNIMVSIFLGGILSFVMMMVIHLAGRYNLRFFVYLRKRIWIE